MTTTTFNTFNPGLAYAEYNQRKLAYIIAAMVAFTMSSYFVVGYLAGNLLFWGWDISQTMNGGVGIGICFVMTAYQFILYSQGDVEGGRRATIVAVCVAVGFSLLSEVGQGMERDHVRMETKSIASPTYQAIVGNISTAASGPVAHPYSAQLQRAEMKLARCQQKVSAGEWDDCVESTARLTSVNNMISQFYEQGQQTAIALTDKAKKLEKDESNYHPLVNLIKNTLSSTGVVASFILSLILIGFFEYAFHYLGRQLAAKRAELLKNGFDVTRKNRKVPNQYKVAGDNNRPTLDESDAQNTWNDELEKSGLASPADAALNQAADHEQAQRIIERGQQLQDGTQDALPNRTLYGQDGTQDTLQNGGQDTTQDGAKSPDVDSLYPVILLTIKKRIIAGDIKPTVRPVTDAILTFARENHQQLKVKPSAFTKPIRQKIAQQVLEQLETESIVDRNPEGGVGKPKYLLAEKYRKQITGSRKKLGTSETQLDLIPTQAQLV